MPEKTLTQNRLKELLNYDPGTGVFAWKVSRGRVKAGSLCTCHDRYGYIYIQINGKSYRAHRLAFLYIDGEIPEQVDHINHIRDDNRWNNIRCASNSINSRNRSLLASSLSGIHGVLWKPDRKRWYSYIRVSGELLYLGFFDNLLDACCARKAAEVKHGFHPNHGR